MRTFLWFYSAGPTKVSIIENFPLLASIAPAVAIRSRPTQTLPILGHTALIIRPNTTCLAEQSRLDKHFDQESPLASLVTVSAVVLTRFQSTTGN